MATTSTVLRVKRRLEENPQDALVLMCKRMKTDTDEISPSLFVFRGTVKNQDPPNVKNIVVPRTDLKEQSITKLRDIIQKLRNERKEKISDSRYEIVNCSRGIKDSAEEVFDLVDLQRKDAIGDAQYAYDLYMAATKDFDVSMLDGLVRIEHYESDLVTGNGADSGSELADDDEDSNDENNWRNEYPDSEGSTIDDEDIARAMERVDLDNELSSDEGEDRIYSDGDVTRYGAAYAKYKARVMGEGGGGRLLHCVPDDDEDDDGFKESDDEAY